MRAHFPAAVLTLLAASAHADSLERAFTGYARSLDTGELLYTESHAVSGRGASEARIVLYRCAGDSVPFARKQLDYSADRMRPEFAFEDARSGYAEGFRRDADGLTVFARAGNGALTRTAPIAPSINLVVDAGFDDYVRNHWDSLERGASPRFAFLVPSLLKILNFRIRKVGEATIDGDTASVIRLSLTGPVGWLLPDIDVSYRQSDRRLMRYRGLTNIRDAAGQLLAAQIDFPDADHQRTALDLAALRSMPLAACSPGG